MQLFGIFDLSEKETAGWLHDADGSSAILAFEDQGKAERFAASTWGYNTYQEAKSDGWCEVRPLIDPAYSQLQLSLAWFIGWCNPDLPTETRNENAATKELRRQLELAHATLKKVWWCPMPKHGESGELVTYERRQQNVHTRCVSRKRWCGKCQDWVGGTGIVSMVIGSVGCPRCGTVWKSIEQPDESSECPF